MGSYYNDNDPFAAAWLRELIGAGHLPAGDVDERSIADVRGDDLRGYVQCHFFAGIGGWPYALRLAGWPDDEPVWTGSCPCQPFSVAGAGKGHADERHLWPEFRRLIAECRPLRVFGEQVAGAAGELWLAGVHVDLEAEAYRVGAASLNAAGVGAPHIRQRLYWLADTEGAGQQGRGRSEQAGRAVAVSSIPDRGVADTERDEWWADEPGRRPQGRGADGRDRAGAGGLGDADDAGPQERGSDGRVQRQAMGASQGQAAQCSSWADSTTILCGDGKWRRVAPGVPVLAHGFPNRVGLLRGFGNAIVPQVAAEFIRAYLEVRGL